MSIPSISRRRNGKLAASLLLLWTTAGCAALAGKTGPAPLTPRAPTANEAALSATVPVVGTPKPETTPSLSIEPSSGWKVYRHPGRGLTFKFPPTWDGPDVYEWGQGVRLEVGSDKVYPYGTDPADRVYTLKDSYFVVIQLTLNAQSLTLDQFRQDQPWASTYFSLLDLQDGQTLTGPRDVVTRLRSVRLGGFAGLEYISTLSPTAQTDMTYIREAVLLDDHLNALTVMGTPNNVEVKDKTQWQNAYRGVDQANADSFHAILDSITIH